MNCQVKICTNPVLVKKRGLCSKHYQRWRNTGSTERRRNLILNKTCIAPGCEKKSVRNPGLCQKHHYRQETHRSFEKPPPQYGSPRERFFSGYLENPDTGCFEWKGAPSSDYPVIRVKDKNVPVHRYSYELHVGPIPKGLVINHKCWNTRCVNPEHLEAITPQENLRYRKGASRTNKIGVRNVYWDASRGQYRVAVQHLGKRHQGGRFSSLQDAERRAEELRQELWGDFSGDVPRL